MYQYLRDCFDESNPLNIVVTTGSLEGKVDTEIEIEVGVKGYILL